MTASAIDRLRAHDFDGIQEYDNALPRWWLTLFQLTIAFAIGYLLWYHYLGGGPLGVLPPDPRIGPGHLPTPAQNEPELRAASRDPRRIAHGQQLFVKALCSSCHGSDATGLVGPNLRDRWWIHGSDLCDLVQTISDGRANGAMPAQRANLSRNDIADLAIYVVSLNRQGERSGKPHDPQREREAPIRY
jgi:cytochrome c oxidase cbb3-type subunit 3